MKTPEHQNYQEINPAAERFINFVTDHSKEPYFGQEPDKITEGLYSLDYHFLGLPIKCQLEFSVFRPDPETPNVTGYSITYHMNRGGSLEVQCSKEGNETNVYLFDGDVDEDEDLTNEEVNALLGELDSLEKDGKLKKAEVVNN
ncbi:MAG TPA: hypothetical protein VLF63_01070 [Patescibacteria group bacterium]|nr:hypothetical protein [Patescibacteria group bacterium]